MVWFYTVLPLLYWTKIDKEKTKKKREIYKTKKTKQEKI